MSTYPTANQQEPRRCDNCGAPVVGRFSPCLVCHSLALDGSATHAAEVPGPYVTQQGAQRKARVRLPARRIWHPAPDTLVYPYDSIDEAELLAKTRRRSRGRIVLATSVLAVSSAVYLVCIHGDDLRVGAPSQATRNLSAQSGKPSIAGAVAGGVGAAAEQLQAGNSAQQRRPPPQPQQQPADVAQRVASVRSSSSSVPLATPPAASPPAQRQVVSTPTDPTRVAAARPSSAEQKLHVDAQPGATAQQPPAVVAQNLASVRPAPVTPLVTPPAASPPEQRQVVSAPPDPTRVAAAQPTSAAEKLHVDARSSATAQQPPAVVAQNLASVRPAPVTPLVTPPAASPPAQRPVVSAPPNPTRVATAQPSSAEQKLHVDAQPGATAQQPPAVVAQNLASVRPAPVTPLVTPPAASPPEQRQVVSAPPDPTRVAAAQPTSAAEKLHVDARSSATAQQPPAVVAQNLASVRPAPVTPLVTPPATSQPAQHPIVSTPPDPTRVATARPTSAEQKLHVDARPNATAQQPPAVVAQNLASVRPAPVTPPAASPPAQRQVISAPPDPTRVATARPTSAAEKSHVDVRPSGASQQQSASVASRVASVRPAVVTPPVTPPASAPSGQRRVALATPDPTRATAPQPLSAEDKQRVDAARYLRAARASMKANNLSAAKSQLAAAIAAQPDNREARRLRSTMHTLEQQRDALLSLARSCGDIGHLACTSRDAAIALQIDSSSKAARHLATRALRESELRIEPAVDAVTGPLPAMRYVSTHH